jgi:hypothetical protein
LSLEPRWEVGAAKWARPESAQVEKMDFELDFFDVFPEKL